MWRDQGAREEIVELVPGTCLTIPVGTRFQSQSDDQNLEAVAVTMPPWPGGGGRRGRRALASDGGIDLLLYAAFTVRFILASTIWAHFSPIIMLGAFVLPEVSVGMTEASATRKPSIP